MKHEPVIRHAPENRNSKGAKGASKKKEDQKETKKEAKSAKGSSGVLKSWIKKKIVSKGISKPEKPKSRFDLKEGYNSTPAISRVAPGLKKLAGFR